MLKSRDLHSGHVKNGETLCQFSQFQGGSVFAFAVLERRK